MEQCWSGFQPLLALNEYPSDRHVRTLHTVQRSGCSILGGPFLRPFSGEMILDHREPLQSAPIGAARHSRSSRQFEAHLTTPGHRSLADRARDLFCQRPRR
jgi:hypothetical protein